MTGEISVFGLESNVIKDHGSQAISEFNGHLTPEIDKELMIKPYQGVGPIALGMTVEEVRGLLKSPVKTFLPHRESEMPTDAFDELGIQVEYKKPGICHGIILTSPAKPTFQGRLLIGQPYIVLKEWFLAIDPDVTIDDVGLQSDQFGLGLYAPFCLEVPDEPVEAVVVFTKEYYQ